MSFWPTFCRLSWHAVTRAWKRAPLTAGKTNIPAIARTTLATVTSTQLARCDSGGAKGIGLIATIRRLPRRSRRTGSKTNSHVRLAKQGGTGISRFN